MEDHRKCQRGASHHVRCLCLQLETVPQLPTNNTLSNPAADGSKDQHASPLDELLSPTTTQPPTTSAQSFPRSSVAESDFGEVGLNDDERFSTVSLNAAAARDSTVAIKSPTDESVPKPWTEDEPAPAPSEISGTAIRASFMLQRLGNDVAPGTRRSQDGQQKLQDVFERAQRESKELEGDVASVDWGACSSGLFDIYILFC